LAGGGINVDDTGNNEGKLSEHFLLFGFYLI